MTLETFLTDNEAAFNTFVLPLRGQIADESTAEVVNRCAKELRAEHSGNAEREVSDAEIIGDLQDELREIEINRVREAC